jgi:hypothetical protein
MRKALVCAVSVQLLASAQACLAEDGQKQRAFTQLIADGYEIKAVTLNPTVQETGGTVNHMLVTLQKDRSVAVCTFAPHQWEGMIDSVLAESKWCDVR